MAVAELIAVSKQNTFEIAKLKAALEKDVDVGTSIRQVRLL
jgi:hypothetical protein